MPRVLLGIAVVFLLLLALACGDDSTDNGDNTFQIQVSGDGLQPFKGSYSVVNTAGNVETVNVEGEAPAGYKVKGIQVDCRFQKSDKTGLLRVVVLKQGKVVGQGETRESFGTIWITAR